MCMVRLKHKMQISGLYIYILKVYYQNMTIGKYRDIVAVALIIFWGDVTKLTSYIEFLAALLFYSFHCYCCCYVVDVCILTYKKPGSSRLLLAYNRGINIKLIRQN